MEQWKVLEAEQKEQNVQLAEEWKRLCNEWDSAKKRGEAVGVRPKKKDFVFPPIPKPRFMGGKEAEMDNNNNEREGEREKDPEVDGSSSDTDSGEESND